MSVGIKDEAEVISCHRKIGKTLSVETSRRAAPFGLAALLGLAVAAGEAQGALAVIAEFTDQPDIVMSEDLWRASYRLEGADFLNDQGFTIYFDPLLFTNLSGPLPPLNAGWDLLLVQPDPVLPGDGLLDGLATTDLPSLAQPFVVDFAWLGVGRPPEQTWETYDLLGGFAITGSGSTLVIPEPTSCFLVVVGCVLAFAFRRAFGGGR